MVCLLGRPWDPVFCGPWDWPPHFPPLSGKKAHFFGLEKVYTPPLDLGWYEDTRTQFTDDYLK